jgi:ADP-dependent NAD(P)H-hydrate dehydratase / NAD(P)H-hydrate epimerase
MQRVLTTEEMRWCDETTIQKHGIPGIQLMENAGRSVVEILQQQYTPLSGKHILIVCGKGNNGGDGFVIARLLAENESQVTVILLASPTELKGDAAINFQLLVSLSERKKNILHIKQYSKRILNSISKPDLIVDAIFGTGFSGAARKPASDVIAWINTQNIPVASVDIPSGVNGTTGVAEGEAIHAERTVTLAALKTGLLCNQGKEFSGEIHCTDIGIPFSVLHHKRFKSFMIEAEDVRVALPRRSVFAHKYSVGKIFVLAGSKGLTGAAALTCMAAMRSGAGAVMLGTPESVYPILARKLTEVMVNPLPTTKQGTLAFVALPEIEKKLSWADVVVIGPGLSQHLETQKLISKIVAIYCGKLLLDADGLNACTTAILRSSKAKIILTPHVGEFSHLTKIHSKDIEAQRIDVARNLAKKIQKTVVLKGVPTVTASQSGKAFLNSTGNPGMATAGSGDVLSGIIAGLWAQGMNEEEAAYSGVFLHGRAGDLAAKKLGERSIIASDLIKYLPAALKTVE